MELSDKNIFHSDLKLSNIIFKKVFELNIDINQVIVEPKLIDFRGKNNNSDSIIMESKDVEMKPVSVTDADTSKNNSENVKLQGLERDYFALSWYICSEFELFSCRYREKRGFNF